MLFLFGVTLEHAAECKFSSFKFINCILYVTDILDRLIFLSQYVVLLIDSHYEGLQRHDLSFDPIVDVAERILLIARHYLQFVFETFSPLA